jgi:hypothetical protein
MKMLRGMLILRRIAAAHVPASQAKPQVNPFITHFHAFFANMLVCGFKLDLIYV